MYKTFATVIVRFVDFSESGSFHWKSKNKIESRLSSAEDISMLKLSLKIITNRIESN